MFRNFVAAVALCMTTSSFAAPIIIEGFDDLNDPANWQINLTQGHTHNAGTTGNVPQYVTSGTANYAGRFVINWETANPVASPENPYQAFPGHEADPLTYYAARFNINAPGSLPSNAIATDTGILQADITNTSQAPVYVALVVDNAASSQLESGPLVPIGANQSITYSWDFASHPPVGFDTGDGVFFGSVQRVKSLLVYSPTLPSVAQTGLLVDNIRNASVGGSPIPTTPAPVSLLKGAATGEVIFSWKPSVSQVVTGYNIYVATDANFGMPVLNRLTFPTTPAKSVGANVTSTVIDGILADQNIYVAITALNEAAESPLSQAFAIRLPATGTLMDRLVLDHDKFAPSSVNYTAQGYAHAAVYNAQALGGLGRGFDSVSAEAVDAELVTLPSNDQTVVIWSNLLDGDAAPAITVTNLARITAVVESGGNVIVSGTNVAEQLGGTGSPLETHLYALLLNGNVGLSDVTPVGALNATGPFSTACNPATNAVAYATTANDSLIPADGAVELALYTGVPRSNMVGGIGFARSLVYLGFAFESVGDPAGPQQSAAVRQNLMAHMIDYLLENSAVRDWTLYAD